VSDEQLTLDGFQLVNCIASGNDTQVWEVLNEGGGQRFAMKLLLPEAFKNPQKKAVLKKEGKAGKLFDHPNLIKVHDVVISKKHGYLIMEYFRAANLKSQIHNDLHSIHVRMKRLVEQLCLGLAYIHDRGWLHRDMKPDNILFNRGAELRIIDFSLASKGKKMKSKEIQGTKSYIAPEVLLRQAITAQTDMYSLGVTLFVALTGEFPITGMTPTELLKNHLRVTPPNPSQLNPNVTPEMDQFVLTMLSKAPAKRFKTMDEAYSIARNLKIWKEDPEAVETRRKEKDDAILRDGVDAARRLDSRSDAARTELLGGKGAIASGPTKAVPKAKPKPQPQKQPAAAQQPGALPMPQPPAYAPMPGYAPPPMQGYPPPGMMPQFYPQMPPQPYGMPTGGYPPQPGPGQMPPQPAPAAPQQPAAAAPPNPPQPAPPAKPQPKPDKKPQEINIDELPLMEELPPVF
jgi:serine/threonine-protein kinase